MTTFQHIYRAIHRFVVFAVGSTILLLGVVLLFTPGPAFVIIPIGLAILAIEFAWARRWLRQIRDLVEQRNNAAKMPDTASPDDGGASKN